MEEVHGDVSKPAVASWRRRIDWVHRKQGKAFFLTWLAYEDIWSLPRPGRVFGRWYQ